MTTDTVSMSFGELITAAIDPAKAAVVPVAPDVFVRHEHGVELRLPVFGQAALDASDPASGVSQAAGVPTWLSGGQDDEIERRLTFVPVTSKEGTIPFGAALPIAVVVGEFGSPFAERTEQAITESEYNPKFIESRVKVSNQTIIQAEPGTLEAVEDSLRQASRDLLVRQLLVGPGGVVGNVRQYQGVETLALEAANTDTYQSSGNGLRDGILNAEDALLDADAARDGLVWAFGRTLHSFMRGAVLDPGSGEFYLQDGRTFTGLPAVRSKDLGTNTGILLDVRNALALPASVQNQIFVNRISQPGETLLTARTHVDAVWMRPELVFRLTAQA